MRCDPYRVAACWKKVACSATEHRSIVPHLLLTKADEGSAHVTNSERCGIML